MTDQIAFTIRLELPYAQAVEHVTRSLQGEGFGVISSIDVKATLQEKLGEPFRPYVILGACNPPLAHRALSTDPRIGVMLPCNVTVEALEGGQGSLVSIADPGVMLSIGSFAENEVLRSVASEVRERMLRVVDSLRS